MSDREIMNAKNYGKDVHSYIGRWNFAVHDFAKKIKPEINEYIQEVIAWQTDGYEFADHLEGDDYMQFCIEAREELIKQLKNI